MKKPRHIALFFLLCFSALPAKALEIFACEPEWGALARALGGEQVKVYTATTNRQDPHYIQARPSLIARARRADLLVCTGAELEVGWLPLLLQKSGNARIQIGKPGYFMASEFVTLLEKPAVLDRSQGDVHADGNPHIHLDPVRLQQVAVRLGERLREIDPAHAAHYRALQEEFLRAWREKITQWEEKAGPLRGKSVVVHHQGWVYLRAWAGIGQAGALEPIPGIPPTSAHLSRLLAHLRETPAHRIVYANHQDTRPVEWLSQKTGIPAAGLDFGPGPGESLMDWFDGLLDRLL